MSEKRIVVFIARSDRERAMEKFERHDLVKRSRVVSVTVRVVADDSLRAAGAPDRDATGPGIEQQAFQVTRELIAIPDAEVIELVAAEKEPLEAERRDRMIDPRHPLRHAVVVGILGLELKLEHLPGDGRIEPVRAGESAIGSNIRSATSPSAISRRQTSLFVSVDCGARKTVRTKSLSRYGDRSDNWVCSSASRP
jgi:hypothetical protein